MKKTVFDLIPEHIRALGAYVPGKSMKQAQDRKSTRLNSSHQIISYAVFCLKKKKKQHKHVDRVSTYEFFSCRTDFPGWVGAGLFMFNFRPFALHSRDPSSLATGSGCCHPQ